MWGTGLGQETRKGRDDQVGVGVGGRVWGRVKDPGTVRGGYGELFGDKGQGLAMDRVT